MENKAWECPRCHSINAPFNPACSCNPEKLFACDEWVNDAVKIFNQYPGQKIIEQISKEKDERCLICNGFHGAGRSCMTLGC